MGCDCKSQTEDVIDQNQYFPYNLTDQTLCMRTISGRTINEIFRDHVFQISFIFHGRVEAIVLVVLLLSSSNGFFF